MKNWVLRLGALGAVLLVSGMLSVGGCKKTESVAADSKAQSAEQPKAKRVIGVSLLTLSNPFFNEMGAAMTAEAAKNGFEVRITSAEMDPAKQRDQVKDFIVSKVNCIILTPADSKAIGTAIREANEAGIPVLTADIASLDPGAKVVCHIATDNFGGGVQAAQAVVAAVGGRGEVAIIDHPEVESGLQRTKGFESELAKTPDVKIVAKLPGSGQREKSFKVMQDILQAHPNLQAVFAINDPCALGAVAALEAAKKLDQVKVVGFDGQPEAKIAIRDGRIYADAVQYPQRIGELTIDAFLKYDRGEKVDPQILIPTGLYKKSDAQNDPTLK